MQQEVPEEEELAALRAENARLKELLDQLEVEHALEQFELEHAQEQRRLRRKGMIKWGSIILASGLLYLTLLFVSITKISGSSPPPFWQAVFIALVGTPLFLLALLSCLMIDDFKRKKQKKKPPAL
ncbi:MAG TPA: hypothetical protein VH540_21905 [Ktedonobacterales bacterium]|jgi:hypothetical protein